MVTLAVVVPIARYRHAHTSNHVLRRSRDRRTCPPTARASAGRRAAPAAARPEAGRTPRSGSAIQRRDAHQSDELQPLGGLRAGTDLVNEVLAADIHPAALDIAVEADLDVDPQRLAAPAVGKRPGCGPVQRAPSPSRCRRSARRTPTPRSTAPCCAGSGRPCASEPAAEGNMAPTSAALFDASCSRDSPNAVASQTRQNKYIACRKEFRYRQQFNFVGIAAGGLRGARKS